LFNRSRQPDDRGNRREQSTTARQAAEALFAPKPQPVSSIIREAAPAGEAARKPRVLAVAAAMPAPYNESEAPPGKAVIPAAHAVRIRAWLKYGMSAAQVAEMYGVAASEVEGVLRGT
jgi:hypothetical protein